MKLNKKGKVILYEWKDILVLNRNKKKGKGVTF